GNGLITPQPSHHFGHDRAAHCLPMTIHAPGIVNFVTLGAQSLHEPDVLVKPVARFVVGAVGGERAVIVAAVLKKDTDRFLFALQHDIRVLMPAPDISEASDNAENLPELRRPLPCYGERRDRAGTGAGDAMLLRISRDVVILVK